MPKVSEQFIRLVKIMDELREKCPWDKKQTIETLRQLTLEETYELVESINQNDWKGIKEELGDLMLHLIFYAKIAEEQGQFSLADVLAGICDKLIFRHPHIYGDVTVKDDEEVKQNWEKLKIKEGKKSILAGVPAALPSMIKAMRLQEKSKTVGFEWENAAQVWDKVDEELKELKEAVLSGKKEKMEDELGDVFFSLVNYARFLDLDADKALERTNRKFIKRFNLMESLATKADKSLHDMSLEEMNMLWNSIKKDQHLNEK